MSADSMDAATRSRVMRAIRSRDTGPELAVRRALWRRGVRYRVHVRQLPGTPDLVVRRTRLAVFVDGEFWHGRAGLPATRREWWKAKFRANRARDRRADRALLGMGWTVLRIADRTVRDQAGADAAALLIAALVKAADPRRLDFARWLLGVSLHRLSTRSTGSE